MVWGASDPMLLLLHWVVGSRAGHSGRTKQGDLSEAFPYQSGRNCGSVPAQHRFQVLQVYQVYLGDEGGGPRPQSFGFGTWFPHHTLTKSPCTCPQDEPLTTSQGSCSTFPVNCLLPVDFCFLALFEGHLNFPGTFKEKKKTQPGSHHRLISKTEFLR